MYLTLQWVHGLFPLIDELIKIVHLSIRVVCNLVKRFFAKTRATISVILLSASEMMALNFLLETTTPTPIPIATHVVAIKSITLTILLSFCLVCFILSSRQIYPLFRRVRGKGEGKMMVFLCFCCRFVAGYKIWTRLTVGALVSWVALCHHGCFFMSSAFARCWWIDTEKARVPSFLSICYRVSPNTLVETNLKNRHSRWWNIMAITGYTPVCHWLSDLERLLLSSYLVWNWRFR